MRRISLAALLSLMALAPTLGCGLFRSRPQLTVAGIGATARENALRANTYFDKKVLITGTVVDSGLYVTQRATVEERVNGEAPVPAELLKRQRESPYLVLEDEATNTRLYCFFASHRAPDAAAISRGQTVTLQAIMSGVEVRDRVVAVAWYCLPNK